MTMLAWKNDEKLKKTFVDRLEEHARMDRLIQGVGYENGKGCNIGCLFNGYDHAAGARESGIPEVVLRLADRIFEALPAKDAAVFALEWPKSIKPGADLSRFRWEFCAFLMRENIKRVLALKIDDELKGQIVAAIRGVLHLHEESARTGTGTAESAWSAAESAVRSAAESAAEFVRLCETSEAFEYPRR